MSTATKAAIDVLAERQRQVSTEGWTPEHDDEHADGDLALAAACYALPEIHREVFPRKDARDVGRSAGESIIVYDDVLCPVLWPWHGAGWKPKDRREDLVRAGALILAEIERMDRAAGTPTPTQVSTTGVLIGQILVMATLLERTLRIVKNVEAEGSDEEELLQELIEQGEDAIATVLKAYAMPSTPTAAPSTTVDHHPV